LVRSAFACWSLAIRSSISPRMLDKFMQTRVAELCRIHLQRAHIYLM
jgi:hypothetical protein